MRDGLSGRRSFKLADFDFYKGVDVDRYLFVMLWSCSNFGFMQLVQLHIPEGPPRPQGRLCSERFSGKLNGIIRVAWKND